MTTFTEKQLRFTFTLTNNATFEGSGNNVLTITGLRASIAAKGSGMPAFPEAEARIYGLRQDDMNALTALANVVQPGAPIPFQRNTMTVEANSGDGWGTVFAGQIVTAGPDYSNMPDVALRVMARIMFFDSINPATPTVYTGPTDVATIVSAIAAKMGKVLENNGVTTQLSSPYLPNTLTEQLRSVAEQAGIDFYNDFADNVIAICPRGVPRSTPIWVLSPATGLVGYPGLDSFGYATVKSVYNPAFRFGGRIRIVGSDVPRANGDWQIRTIAHNLESMKPGGNWFSELTCYPPGVAILPAS